MKEIKRYFFFNGIPHKSYDGQWCEYSDVEQLQARIKELESAERTLQHLGYQNLGGEMWKPPVNKPVDFNLVDFLKEKIREFESLPKGFELIDSAPHALLGEGNVKVSDVYWAEGGEVTHTGITFSPTDFQVAIGETVDAHENGKPIKCAVFGIKTSNAYSLIVVKNALDRAIKRLRPDLEKIQKEASEELINEIKAQGVDEFIKLESERLSSSNDNASFKTYYMLRRRLHGYVYRLRR